MIFALSYHLVTWVYALLWFAPSNVIIRYIRSPGGVKWAFPVSVVMTPAYYGATVIARMLAETGLGWLHLFVLLFAFSTFKFFAAIFISPFWMLGHWWRGRRAQQGSLSSPPS